MIGPNLHREETEHMENRHKVLMLGPLPEPAADLFRARDDVIP
jgi:hypothetical protein